MTQSANTEKELANAEERDLIKRLLAEHFDGIFLIECASGSVKKLAGDSNGEPLYIVKFNGGSYEEQVRKLVEEKVFPADADRLKEELSLNTVRAHLEHDKTYNVVLSIKVAEDKMPLYKKFSFAYSDPTRSKIVLICEDISDIISNETDPMTGLYNFSGFHKHVREWIAANPGRKFRMQRYNIDKFRDINGVYGYATGNRLLRDFARYMKRYNTKDSFAAHLSADHFIRFCAEDALTVKECYDNFTACFNGYALNIPIMLHMGVYDLCEPDCDSHTMSYKALLALQSIKGSLSKRIAYYEKGMMAEEREQQALLSEIEDAIAREEFEVWFQPQVDYATKKLIGAEALIRWKHPTKGILPPCSFIPLLEKSDYISDVDKYILEKVCSYLRRWSKEIWHGQFIPVSVNLSRNDVYKEDLCDAIAKILEEHEIPPYAVHLEITESAYMENAELLINTVKKLRQKGYIVEMDDFGSGYSSLNSLKNIYIDKLKLDMKFLLGAENSRSGKIILASVINMAKGLGLPVIAEGVEAKEDADMLLTFGCNQMQGYYFSKPVPAEAFEEMLRNMDVSFN